jgi:hypothetical protein
MSLSVTKPALALLAGVALATPALANTLECSDFTVMLERDAVEYIDHGEAGLSTGDRRVGRYFLNDDQGNRIGTMDYITTVLVPLSDGHHPLHAAGHHLFDNGQITHSLIYDLTDPTSEAVVAEQAIFTVTGGTGAFDGVSGSIELVETDGMRQLQYSISCPGD